MEITLNEIREKFETPYMKFWNTYLPELSKEEQDKLYEEAIHEAEEAFLFDGVLEVIQELHRKGVQLFVISSDPYSKLLLEAKEYGISDFFLELIGGVHEKEYALLSLIKKYDLDRSKTIFIGDTCGDIRAGKKAGVTTIGISWGFNVKEKLLAAKPDFIFDDIREIKKLF